MVEATLSRRGSDDGMPAIDYAERFALDHESIDDADIAALLTYFSDSQVFELTASIARHLGFGRMTQVLGIADTCELH